MEKKLQKICPACYNLLRDLCILPNLVNNLSQGIPRINCRHADDDKKCGTCGTKYKYCKCFLEYAVFEDDLIEYKCLAAITIAKQSLIKSQKKKKILIRRNFLTMITSLFYYYEKMFILTNK